MVKGFSQYQLAESSLYPSPSLVAVTSYTVTLLLSVSLYPSELKVLKLAVPGLGVKGQINSLVASTYLEKQLRHVPSPPLHNDGQKENLEI